MVLILVLLRFSSPLDTICYFSITRKDKKKAKPNTVLLSCVISVMIECFGFSVLSHTEPNPMLWCVSVSCSLSSCPSDGGQAAIFCSCKSCPPVIPDPCQSQTPTLRFTLFLQWGEQSCTGMIVCVCVRTHAVHQSYQITEVAPCRFCSRITFKRAVRRCCSFQC